MATAPTRATVRACRAAACLASLLALLLGCASFAPASAHAVTWKTPRITWQNKECWQTGGVNAESFSCENPAASGYLATHTKENEEGSEDIDLTKSGQYCSDSGLKPQLEYAEEGVPFAGMPSPGSSHEEGNRKEDACAVWSSGGEQIRWGMQLNNNPKGGHERAEYECKDPVPAERCSIQHYFSLAGQGLNDRPWASYLGAPLLILEHPEGQVYETEEGQGEILMTQPGEKGIGWGYVCAVLEEAKGNVVELCDQEWFGRGAKNEEFWEWGPNEYGDIGFEGDFLHVAQCRDAEGSVTHNHDRLIMRENNTLLRWIRDTEIYPEDGYPPPEADYPISKIGSDFEIDRGLVEAATKLDNASWEVKTTPGGYSGEPAVGAGCGRSSWPTSPAEWALIGVENGIEEWDTGRGAIAQKDTGEVKVVDEPETTRTYYEPNGLEPTTPTVTKTGEHEVTITAEVNPFAFSTSYIVEYGEAERYGVSEHKTAAVPTGDGIAPVPISVKLTGLEATTSYEYRIKFFRTTSEGTEYTEYCNGTEVGGCPVYSKEQTFATTGRPKVETSPPSNVEATHATLEGLVFPGGSEAKYYFEYGQEEGKLASKTEEGSMAAGTSWKPVGAKITLEPKTYYRLVATNSSGTSYGAIEIIPVCSNISGEGDTQPQAVWTAGFTATPGPWEANCGRDPTISYTLDGSGAGLTSWGAEKAGNKPNDGKKENPAESKDQFIGSDEPLDEAQMKDLDEAAGGTGQTLVIPVAQEAVAVIVHPPTGCEPHEITNKSLLQVWTGETKKWGQVKPKPAGGASCEKPITRVVREDSSGTAFVFKTYLREIEEEGLLAPCNKSWKEMAEPADNLIWPTSGKEGCPSGLTTVKEAKNSGGGGEVEEVKETEGGIGYANLGDARGKYTAKELEWLKIQNNGVKESSPSPTYANPGTTPAEPGGVVSKANCVGTEYGTLPSTPAADDNLSGLNGAHPSATNYPICTLTYDIALVNYETAGYGAGSKWTSGMATGEYLKFMVGAGPGESEELIAENHDYDKLPEMPRNVLKFAREEAKKVN